ncbi:MAG: hypothetical protein QF493_10420, partial [Rhodospirillales bacterium]|nr:hypothetical protein [Rhodospirillales bacterium]
PIRTIKTSTETAMIQGFFLMASTMLSTPIVYISRTYFRRIIVNITLFSKIVDKLLINNGNYD